MTKPPPPAQRQRMWDEYCLLKGSLGVTPHLETLLVAAGKLPEAAGGSGGSSGSGKQQRKGGGRQKGLRG